MIVRSASPQTRRDHFISGSAGVSLPASRSDDAEPAGQRGGEALSYGAAAAFGAGEPCERQAVEQLVDLQRQRHEYQLDDLIAEDEFFYTEQNARTVRDAEEYYRSMFGGQVSSWNLRNRDMVDTLDALAAHLSRQRREVAKIVVWTHNSHLGDGRATESSARGEFNVCQLVRERHPGTDVLHATLTSSLLASPARAFAALDQASKIQ
jgi:erythromycin esterase-like protein